MICQVVIIMKINKKFIYEESRLATNVVVIFGYCCVIAGAITVIAVIINPFILAISIPLIFAGLCMVTLKRFRITREYVQFPKLIQGSSLLRYDNIKSIKLIEVDKKITKQEVMEVRTKDKRILIIRETDDLYIEDFSKLKKAFYLEK